MATMMAREAWTDERLDDLNKRVDDGFNEMREEFRAVRSELGGRIDKLDAKIDAKIDAKTDGLDRKIDGLRAETHQQFAALQRTMLQLSGGMFATFVIGFLTILVAILLKT